ncbi:hypothetical protein OAS19_05860 [Altererythrobacter sp.]|nr:hypothetical protein [Altererythrobacter sp.]
MSTAKMYQHFAVVTVLVTASMALMADDDAQATIGQELKKQADSLDTAGKTALKNSGATIEWRSGQAPPPKASQGFGANTAFGSPTIGVRGKGTVGQNMTVTRSKLAQDTEIWEKIGMSEEAWNALSAEEQSQYLNGRNVMLTGSAREREQAMRAISNAARDRSGAGSVAASPDSSRDY